MFYLKNTMQLFSFFFFLGWSNYQNNNMAMAFTFKDPLYGERLVSFGRGFSTLYQEP